LKALGPTIYSQFSVYFKRIFLEYTKSTITFDFSTVANIFIESLLVMAKTALPFLLIAVFAGLISGYVQVGFLFTLETLKMQFNRINPFSGFKRLFSLRSVVELVKSIIKIIIVSFVAYSYLSSQVDEVLNLMDEDLLDIATFIGTATFSVALRICIALIILGLLDYLYQRFDYEKSLKMTKQEIKEEYKQLEGNPEIKSKIKQKQRQISMKRMMQDVPKADVVITNPTHFAVALKYDAEKSSAPIVTAKGQDYIALRIKQVARDNKVEIVENKQLARSIYSTVEIGEAIPAELYQAVAEILAFVYSLKNGGRAS
jgi:flagellar biosynthetic protein FlhB